MRTLLYVSIAITQLFIFEGCTKSGKTKPKYSDYDRGYAYWYYDKLDSEFLMFNRYISNPDDTFRKGSAYKFIGEIQKTIGDPYGAQQSLTNAIKTLDSNNNDHRTEIGNSYNDLGNVSLDLKAYDKAIEFYDKAMKFFNGAYVNPNVGNGKATALQKTGNYVEAIAIYDSMLTYDYADKSIVARIIDNRAKTKWLQDPKTVVLPEFWSALKIRLDSQYTFDLDASYSHLSDYYSNYNSDSALWYAQKMREIATKIRNPQSMLDAIDRLILSGVPAVSARKWYKESMHLRDSIQLARDFSQNRFALIKFEVEKKKTDDLISQQKIARQRLWTYFSIGAGIIIIIILIVLFNRRRKRLKQESADAIRDSNLKISQRVHDVVANGLYGIMNELEHKKDLEKESLITKIEDLYEESRDISYEDPSNSNNMDYYSRISQLFTGYSTEETKVFVFGNEQTFWNRINDNQKYELYLVLKNIMINMKKHSGAKNVVVEFVEENEKAGIIYKDDGIGLLEKNKFGNGLNNTVNRIRSLNGDINFGKNEKGGTLIEISFPFKSRKHD